MPLTILVVDDDLGTRLSISDYLDISGYSVIAAENGQEALRLVEQYQPHLIVTDIAMPEMDGYELIKRVRARPVFRLLPVIFLTAHTSTKERIRGYQLGCDNYLPKPFELEELGVVIRSLLERSQLIESEWRVRLADTVIDVPDMALEPVAVKSQPTLEISLTQREQQVLDLLAEGLSNIAIGDHLHLSPRTVEKYVSSLFRKTDSNNRAELIRFALKHNLIS
ncbi:MULTISPECIES: response regulator transcription factor [Planktothrix]|uniref:Response regulator transcription factor n=1 Tax=Planktothrix mougeotii LEGE 06226 TaxID=1828728 RepID=A0ABR9UB03_9CYAN|nr:MULTISPECIES: response regulator transcription factor [Planktothrix]MBD2480647.1 response regulator transcription factor [Planktothrix sp. FACHB-1365]MBE9143642.1 response regulator transcription factor [Planktothrix mougeotii LEGE 06226]